MKNYDIELPEGFVRCKDCEHSCVKKMFPDSNFCKLREFFCSDNWFCADGKKEDELCSAKNASA